jgi:hypothetical protein
MVALAAAVNSMGCEPPSQSPSQSPPASSKAHVESLFSVKASDNDMPKLIIVSISPEARVKATAVDQAMELQQGEWQEFAIEIDNAAGITSPMVVESEQIMTTSSDASRSRWLQLEISPSGPLTGDRTEVRKMRLKSRDAGIRTAILNLNAGQGTQDLGFRSDVMVTFRIHKNR